VEPELVESYVENGTLRIQWRDFAYLGQESVKAARAAREAQEQGSFWEYHDALYENQGSINGGTFSDEKLTELARGLGLDVESFESGLASGRYEMVVRRDLQEAREAGIQGTPSFIINGQRITGPIPLEDFKQVIDDELRKTEGA
jgi:protein-disulfide isomerase